MKQFLLNFDGTLPNGMTAERCEALGLTPVLPTPPPKPPEGFVAVEAGAMLDLSNGVWRQVWRLEFAPAEAPAEAPTLPDLDRAQFAYLLALGPEDIWAQVEAAAKAADREIYAQLRELRERSTFNFEVTLAMIAQFAPFLPEGVDLSRETLGAAWAKAAARNSEGAAL